ncbi:hypothetical protein A3K55_00815 [Candidatus Shapirobacteria bacterium RBG_13_44_7]|uniref:Polyprenyl synthetase n=1 Tax=Candidatus Shapirobacteria bacterium RBG_13_44_7 TaxID=1802149 RepID=A0A1F7SJ33_9BACT|nr:MAG: hypothetical protein A3K55_00815 [Candidatus Shapirobacteria bacterium RBG_13_44_7]
MDAKQKLLEYVEFIDKKLDEYWKEELAIGFGFNEKQKALVIKMLEHSREHNLRPAKRLRGSFVNYGFILGGEKADERVCRAAMAVEIVHTALLMMDDVMDQDNLRRGKPTTHKFFEGEDGDGHYGESMAYSTSIAILTIGYQLMLDSGFDNEKAKKVSDKFLRGVANTAYGQAYDVNLEKIKDDWGEDDVMVLHKAKTAIYTYENPLFVGAILAGLEGKVYEILHDYSMDGGVAFQLQDDILGVYGDPEKTGKSADSDLLQGKCTLLVIKLLKDGTPEQIKALNSVWGKRTASREAIDLAKQAIIESGSLEYSRKISKEYAARAAKIAEKLRELNLNKEAIDYIQGIAEYMVNRDV